MTYLYTLCPQAMVSKVSAMLKTVKNVEDEAGRGVRSLENTIDSIDADIKEFLSDRPPKSEAGPEDLIRSTKVCRPCPLPPLPLPLHIGYPSISSLYIIPSPSSPPPLPLLSPSSPPPLPLPSPSSPLPRVLLWRLLKLLLLVTQANRWM